MNDMTTAQPTAADRWVPRPSLKHARAGLDVATAGEYIIVLGGFGPDLITPEVFDTVEARRFGGSGEWARDAITADGPLQRRRGRTRHIRVRHRRGHPRR
jgi:hypothetical protein